MLLSDWIMMMPGTVETQLMNILWLMMRQAAQTWIFLLCPQIVLNKSKMCSSHSRKLRQQNLSCFILIIFTYQFLYLTDIYNRHCLTLKATLINNNDDNNVLLGFLLLQLNRKQRRVSCPRSLSLSSRFHFWPLMYSAAGLPWWLRG